MTRTRLMRTSASVADVVSEALPVHADGAVGAELDLTELHRELEGVAREALEARSEGLGLDRAVTDPRFPTLVQLHRDLRDAMFVEIPDELRGWVDGLAHPEGADPMTQASRDLGATLAHLARPSSRTSIEARASDGDDGTRMAAQSPAHDGPALQVALAEVLLFEAVRLRLLATMWMSEDFERLGGEESDIDAIAWAEVEAMLRDPEVAHPDVRPLHLMVASASVSLAREAADRVFVLQQTSAEVREQLGMRARLRSALRELRLAESVLLENALSALLGTDRMELPDLQKSHPVALEGLSRQAMDQRVSRGRRALLRSQEAWPRRREPALFDLLRSRDDAR